MIKKSAIVLFLVLILLTVNACSVKTNNRKDNNSIVVSTKQVTLIRNSFADVLPNFKFENEINDTYVDGINYKFTVRCSQEECEKYIEKAKKSGFIINSSNGTNYYSAETEDYYSIEITYIGEILTVLCKRV
ncbi:MAG: hypothetical protein IKJ41_05175 [Clostridia bacterium]|nr:hypothetical protein [Clostridia bacterium]